MLKRSTKTIIPAMCRAILITALIICGLLGCGGPRVSGKADTAEAAQDPLAEKLAHIDAKFEILLNELERAADAMNVNRMAGALEKIAGEAEAMVAAAEGHPGITPAEVDSLDKILAKVRKGVDDVMNTPVDLDEIDEDNFLEETVDALLAALNSLNDLEGRLGDLLDTVAPQRTGSVAVLPGDDEGTWFAFKDEDSDLWGYKDKNGTVRIEPRFLSAAPVFDHIVVVRERSGNRNESYYLTKAGKVAARRNVFRNECENDGFVRFKDRKTGMTGMLDRSGNVVIPAEHTSLSKAQNGLVAAYRYYNIRKDGGGECGDGNIDYDEDSDDCDGDDNCDSKARDGADSEECQSRLKWVLLDTSNNALSEMDVPARSAAAYRSLNLYSALKTEGPHPDTTARVSFPAKDGKGAYSFVCYDREFRHWLKNVMIVDLTPEKLAAASLDSIDCFMRPKDDERYASASWRSERQELIGKVYDILQNDLTALSNPERKYKVHKGGNYPSMFSRKDPRFEKYYDNCGNERQWAYPVFWIRLTPDNSENAFGRFNDYKFLRTDDGYKLSSVSVRNNDLFFSAHKDAPANDFVALGNYRFLSGAHDEAAALYSEALERDSSNLIARRNRGVAHMMKGDLVKAMENFNRLIELDPDEAEWYGIRSNAHYKGGEFAKAIAEAERAMRLDSSNVGAYISRALTYAAMGDYKKAAADYDKAVKLEDEAGLVFFNYSVLYAYMGDESKADSLYKKAMQLDPEDIPDYYKEDIDDYSLIIKHFPKNALAHYHRGVIYARMGKYAEAAEDLKAAQKLNSRHALTKKWIGIVDKKLKSENSAK